MFQFVGLLLGCAMALGVSIGVSVLGFMQWRSILKCGRRAHSSVFPLFFFSCAETSPAAFSFSPRNQTEIEKWIVDKAHSRERTDTFVFPYNLGWRNNLRSVHCTRGCLFFFARFLALRALVFFPPSPLSRYYKH